MATLLWWLLESLMSCLVLDTIMQVMAIIWEHSSYNNCPTHNNGKCLYSNYSSSPQRSSYQFVRKATNVLQSCCSDYRLWYRLPPINTLLDNSSFTATIITTFGVSDAEVFATNILTNSAHIMYCCYHLLSQISKKRLNYLFRRYTGYAAFTLVLFFFVTIDYDWRIGNGKYTILVSGYCIVVYHPSYNTLVIS